ncbi:nucleolar protein 8 [Melitaea cinxia]|uniref:nucleolar protein 8 n=1 Tax=Melitaea cinxia TaxID=113334 RepID=UPI001E2744E5|nr:nucleolar protein 8 [Melitaea cinxia]
MALSTRLFVGNLPDNFDEKALCDTFSLYGNVINFDLKTKPGVESDKKTFAFVTISASNFNVESCIKYFSNEDFQGYRLYVTRARESFLERLQREREQSQKSENKEVEQTQTNSINNNFSIIQKPNVNKRKFIDIEEGKDIYENDFKKQNSDKKRLESMKKKRQEFNEKKNIIKSGLISIDKKPNKKVIFSDTEEDSSIQNNVTTNGDSMIEIKNKNLFEDDDSDEEINFEIKKQFEGKKGQKVLDLQSRYKSDKRFVLDERFIEEDSVSEKEDDLEISEEIQVGQVDEKSKQLDILQDVLGVTIKTKQRDTTNKIKAKLGMLRYDPLQPEHAKYLAPVETKHESVKKSKKKKSKDVEDKEELEPQPDPVVEKVEVSKEQFYKISDTLKEAITQPNSFSLRSLFTKQDNTKEEAQEEDSNYIPLQSTKVSKVKNPLEPSEKNPFVYDSSESENEEDNTSKNNSERIVEEKIEPKIVWREKLFFSPADDRLKDGLLFFIKNNDNDRQKERRELKSVMKKRIYNKERKNTMFRKKIGGNKKTMKKKFRKG